MKKVIIVEPNPYHNEVVPGIVRYFEDLGYYIDVYIRIEAEVEKAFCRYAIKGQLNKYHINEIVNILSNEKIQEYDFIFFSSMEYSENGKIERFLDYIGFIPKTKYGVLGMYHTISLIDQFNDHKLMEEGRLFCISDFQRKDSNINVINPHFFCSDLQNLEPFKEKKRFIVVGNSSDIKTLKFVLKKISKNLQDKIEIMHIGKFKYSTNEKIINFIISLVAKGTSLFNVNGGIRFRRLIHHLGRLTFPEMYKEIELSDFVIVMINGDKNEHKHYLTDSTSGIKQIILGFNKVCIIEEETAKVYGFNETESIIYKKNRLQEALAKAVLMEESQFRKMKISVNIKQRKIYMESLQNLKDVIRKLEF